MGLLAFSLLCILLNFSIDDSSVDCKQAAAPPNFPSSIRIYQKKFENWRKNIKVNNVWVTEPKTIKEILTVSNWAQENGYKLRPSGGQFSWSPLTITMDSNTKEKTILIKMAPHLTKIWIPPSKNSGPTNNFHTVTLQTGATLESLMSFLETENLTLGSIPVLGAMTMGGLLAAGSHGTGVPLPNSSRSDLNFGCVSNAIVEMVAVTWNEATGQFQLERFDRSNPNIGPLLVSLGQILVTEVTLRVSPNFNLRGLSRMNITAEDLFAHPETAGQNSFGELVKEFGTVGSLHFPFTTFPWVRIFSVNDQKPRSSRHVTKPYNYPFIENLRPDVATLLRKMQRGNSRLTPLFSKAMATSIRGELSVYRSWDLWGPSKNVMLSVKPSTVQVFVNGFAILTARENLQNVLHQVYTIFEENLQQFAKQDKFPVNGPMETRVSAIDDDDDEGHTQVPIFSASSPANKKFDTIVWTDITTFSETIFVSQFMSKMEDDFSAIFNGDYALLRSEWSKGWSYSVEGGGAWTNQSRMKNISKLYPKWNEGKAILNVLDPHQVFQNEFLEKVL